MWIRSQDRELLINTEFIYIQGSLIRIVSKDGCSKVVAMYSSEEKSLKVLDMIQDKICGINGILKLNGLYDDKQRMYIKKRIDEQIQNGTFLPDSSFTHIPVPLFFQMPQDDEV